MSLRNVTVILFMLVLAACGGGQEPGPAGVAEKNTRPLIIASNYPLYFFAREIAGDSAEVVFPSIEGDPANWKPDSEAIARMQSADLIILNGAAYESWLDWVSLPDDILLDTSLGISDRLIPLDDETVHQHGPEGEHSHYGVAFTIWLDPVLAMEQASAVEQGISELVPENREAHRARLAVLQARLAELDEALRLAFAAIDGQALIFSHPVYQYLAARYALNAVSVHWEPGEDPGIQAWIEFQQTLRRHPAKLMIWEDEPGDATADRLEQLGLQAIPFHTAGNHTHSNDYFEVMNANVDRLNLQSNAH